VLPELRGHGVGKALLRELAKIAVTEQCYGIRWMVLEWNEPALKFYASLGAEILGEWETMLLTGPALKRLAESPATASAPSKSNVAEMLSTNAKTPSGSQE
jgi:ribosomal protein S18 acetylase RimI-like enzyme